MAEIGNVTVKVDAVITDEQYYEAMSAVSAANEYIAALDAENAKLREEIEVAKHDLQVFSMSSVQLDADNAKLRELVRKMWKPFCWAQSGYDVCLPDDEDREIRDLARELGIEVD